MATKTAKGLCAYAEAQLGKPYWYGTFGNMSSASLLATKRKQYPNYYNQANYKVQFTSQYNQRVHDCIGLIKGYLWSETTTSTPKYVASQDTSANGMLGKCKESGTIKTIPEIPGVLVFFQGHVGVYIGNGYVIEARGHDYGVVKTKLSARPWTNWGKCPWIDYSDATTAKKTTTTKTTSTSTTTTKKVEYFNKYTGKSLSIVDALKSQKVSSSREYRAKIAEANGIKNYTSSASQNTKMLKLLKEGKLIKP